MVNVQRERFPGQQVHRNGVAGKRIDSEDIKVLRLLPLQRESCIAHHNVRFCRRIAKVSERRGCQFANERIDIVKAIVVGRFPVSSNGPGAQPDHADACGRAREVI